MFPSTDNEKIILLSEPTIDDVKRGVEELQSLMGYEKEFPYQKILVQFTDEVEVRINSRKTKKLKEMYVKFFESQYKNFCYTFYSRTGYPLSCIDYRKICSLSIKKSNDIPRDKKIKLFLKKFHPNAWNCIKNDPAYLDKISEEDMKTVNIKNKFPEFVIEELKKAFAGKLNYYYRQYGKKRDLTVETKLCEDGEFRAWYSSELAGCLNGSYYLLINPTTAAFREDD